MGQAARMSCAGRKYSRRIDEAVAMNRVVFNPRGRVRTVWRVLLYGSLFVLGSTASAFALALLGFRGPGLAVDSIPAYAMLCLSALVPGVLLVTLVEGVRRTPGSVLGVRLHDRVGRELLQGALIGFLIVLAVWLAMALSGLVEVNLAPLSLLDLIGAFLVLLLAAAFEELFFRGYLLSALIDGAGMLTGVLLTSLMFAIAHNSNPGATWLSFVNTTLAGVLLCVAYLRTRSLWLPTAVHVSWNFTLGVTLGLPVSGIALPQRILESDLTERGGRALLVTGGDYGSEGGLLLTVVVLTTIAWMWRTAWLQPSAQMEPLWLWRVSEVPEDRSGPSGASDSGTPPDDVPHEA